MDKTARLSGTETAVEFTPIACKLNKEICGLKLDK